MYLLCVAYATGLIYVLFVNNRIGSLHNFRTEANAVPFKNIIALYTHRHTWDHEFVAKYWENIIGNLVLFLPMPLLGVAAIPGLRKWRFWKMVFCCMLISAAFEILQYLLNLGAADVDDVLLNGAGAAIGLGLYNGLRRVLLKVK